MMTMKELGLQTLFQVGMKKQDDVDAYMNANLLKWESVDSSHEQDGLYVNEIETNKKTILRTCTNTMDIVINSEPGPGRADKSVDSKKSVRHFIRNY